MSNIVLRLLGIADKISHLAEGSSWSPVDIRGLRFVVMAWLFPFDLRNMSLVFLLEKSAPGCGTIELRHEKSCEPAVFTYKLYSNDGDLTPFDRPLVMGLPLRRESSFIWEPGKVVVTHEHSGKRTELGNIEFIYVDPPPITHEQRLAIQSNPSLTHGIRFIIKCQECGDGITPFTALERVSLEASEQVPRPTWYRDLEDRFICTCGKFSCPLRYLRDGMLSLLPVSNFLLPDGSFASTHQISVQETEKTLTLFRRLIDEAPEEEDVQKFIERHPLMLASFAACWLKPKPPILNKWVADFGIVTAAGDLLLIEIERPSIRLFTQKGIQSAELTQAFSQPRTWKREISRHRTAALSCIEGCPSEVANVRYLVIAGRSEPGNREAIDSIRESDSDCDFMTYDQLIEAVRNTVRSAAG